MVVASVRGWQPGNSYFVHPGLPGHDVDPLAAMEHSPGDWVDVEKDEISHLGLPVSFCKDETGNDRDRHHGLTSSFLKKAAS